MKNQSLLFISAAFIISHTYAAPDDLFLQATPAKNKLTTNASLDLVNDTVDFLDLRESEGVQGDAGDYIGAHISAQYQFHPEWSISASYWRREIEFREDTNKLNSGALGITYFPESLSTDRSNLAFKLSFWGNQADELAKTSPTNVNGRTINEVVVSNPRDTQIQLDTIYTHKIDFMNQVNLFGSFGYSKVKVDELDLMVHITGKRRDCTANINIIAPQALVVIGKLAFKLFIAPAPRTAQACIISVIVKIFLDIKIKSIRIVCNINIPYD